MTDPGFPAVHYRWASDRTRTVKKGVQGKVWRSGAAEVQAHGSEGIPA
jgi:hypothetical protein